MSEDLLPSGKPYPEGLDFLRAAWEMEDRCEELADAVIPTLGEKTPECLKRLGQILSLFDRTASCYWECRGGDHVVERVAGRAYSSAKASLRLLRLGFYDESLALTRNVGEIANLLFLFSNDEATLDDWKASSESKRHSKYRPVAVRIKIEALGLPIPVDQDRYKILSGIATHVTPETAPQAHDDRLKPTLGGYFQEVGLMVSLNELAAATAVAAVCAADLIGVSEERRKRIASESVALLRSIGGVNIKNAHQLSRHVNTPFDLSPTPDDALGPAT